MAKLMSLAKFVRLTTSVRMAKFGKLSTLARLARL